jgi:hypothetical protein
MMETRSMSSHVQNRVCAAFAPYGRRDKSEIWGSFDCVRRDMAFQTSCEYASAHIRALGPSAAFGRLIVCSSAYNLGRDMEPLVYEFGDALRFKGSPVSIWSYFKFNTIHLLSRSCFLANNASQPSQGSVLELSSIACNALNKFNGNE